MGFFANLFSKKARDESRAHRLQVIDARLARLHDLKSGHGSPIRVEDFRLTTEEIEKEERKLKEERERLV
jgi:hypothetical protein